MKANPRVTKRDVTAAAASLQSAMRLWGENNRATDRARWHYNQVVKQWDAQKAKRQKKNPQLLTVNPKPRKRSKRRKNPQLLVVNPSRADLVKARAAYREFHGVEPTKALKLGGKGPVLVALGELREIVYQPRRGHRKGPAFFHHFKPGNLLAATTDGKRLVIIDRRNRRSVDFSLGIVN